jgi:hypothetical protein
MIKWELEMLKELIAKHPEIKDYKFEPDLDSLISFLVFFGVNQESSWHLPVLRQVYRGEVNVEKALEIICGVIGLPEVAWKWHFIYHVKNFDPLIQDMFPVFCKVSLRQQGIDPAFFYDYQLINPFGGCRDCAFRNEGCPSCTRDFHLGWRERMVQRRMVMEWQGTNCSKCRNKGCRKCFVKALEYNRYVYSEYGDDLDTVLYHDQVIIYED